MSRGQDEAIRAGATLYAAGFDLEEILPWLDPKHRQFIVQGWTKAMMFKTQDLHRTVHNQLCSEIPLPLLDKMSD